MNRRRFLSTAAAAVATAPFIGRGAEHDGFEIGLVADAQFADLEPSGTRFYRASVGRLGEAVEEFNRRNLAFCAHLGDLIDREWKSFDEIAKPLAQSRHRWHQLLGNHDFEVLDEEKPRVPRRLGMAWRYGSFDHGGFRFAILDTNDLSTYAHAAGTEDRAQGERELARFAELKLPQAKPWNGGVGPAQLTWLERTCREAREAKLRVILFGHHPVFPEGRHNVWNAADVLGLIERHPHVVAFFNGHNHAGEFATQNGVPFVTLRGMVETADATAFATAKVLRDRIILSGRGREPSRELVFRKS